MSADVFVGRKKDLECLLKKVKKGTQLIQVSGPSMIGKSRCVQELIMIINSDASFTKQEHDIRILTFNFSSFEFMAPVLSNLAVAFSSVGTCENAVYASIYNAAQRVGKILMVFDNIDQLVKRKDTQNSFMTFCFDLVQGISNLILIFTTATLIIFPRLSASQFYTHALHALSADEAISLFCTVLKPCLIPYHLLHKIVTTLGCLPTPVKIIAAQLQELHLKSDDLIDLVENFLEEFPKSQGPIQLQSVERAILTCVSHLDKSKKQACAVLSYLEGSFGVDIAVILLDAKGPAQVKHEVLVPLHHHSLVERNKTGQRYEIPPFLRQMLDRQFRHLRQEPEIFNKFCGYFTDVLKTVIIGLETGEAMTSMKTISEEYPHFRKLLLNLVCNKEEDFVTYFKLVTDGEEILYHFPQASLTFIQNLLAVAWKLGTKAQQAHLLAILGSLMYEIKGKLSDAYDLQKQAEEMLAGSGDDSAYVSVETLNQSTTLASIYRRLCYLYYLKCNPEQGIRYGKKALTLYNKMYEKPTKETSLAITTLGTCYTYKKEFVEGERHGREAYEMKKELLGKHPSLGVSLNNLGLVYSLQGNHEQALPYLKQSLTIRKDFNKQPNDNMVISLRNLAQENMHLGNYEEAIKLIDEAFDIRKQIGNEHPNDSLIAHTRGEIFYRMGEHVQARSYFETAVCMRRKMIGLHLSTCKSLLGLAKSQLKLNQPRDAVKAMEEAVEMGQTVFKRVNVDYTPGEIYVTLTKAYTQCKKYSAAKEYAAIAWACLEETKEAFLKQGEVVNAEYTANLMRELEQIQLKPSHDDTLRDSVGNVDRSN